MKYLIVANGIINSHKYLLSHIRQSDVVVCADGGVRHLKQINTVPDVVIGDLDSIGDDATLYLKSYLADNRVVLVQYPKKKDASDTELAVLWAIEKGATDITLIGATGNRLDHTLSNIFILRTITQSGISCKIVDDHNEIYMLSHDLPQKEPSANLSDLPSDLASDSARSPFISVKGAPGDLLSIIPVTETVAGVTIYGFEYPLNDATLRLGSSHGVSNVFTGDIAYVSLKQGIVLVIKSSD